MKKSKMKEQELEWKVNYEYFKKLTEPEAKFIFEHTEKQLKETLDTAGVITTKSSTLTTLTVGLLAALFGFGVNRWDTKNHVVDAIMYSCLFGCAYLFVIAIALTFLIHPMSYYTVGTEPYYFFCDRFFGDVIAKDDRQKDFYVNEIDQYNWRIAKNKKTNKVRGIIYKIALYLIVFSPVVLLVVYLIRR